MNDSQNLLSRRNSDKHDSNEAVLKQNNIPDKMSEVDGGGSSIRSSASNREVGQKTLFSRLAEPQEGADDTVSLE